MVKSVSCFILVCLCFAANAQDTVSIDGLRNSKLLPTLWHQHAAEYRALCYQAFNIATLRLNALKIRKRHHYAIITDVDETVLDNSYYEAGRIIENKEFETSSWKAWTSAASATPVPGAIEFFQLAAKKGIEVFYISNRETDEVPSTIINLKKLGFPDADESHMLFLEKTSSKEERRKVVSKEHQILLLIGDNLNDFSNVFEKKETGIRFDATNKLRDEWGRLFIVLPNTMYGEWENALLDYSRTLAPAEKELKLKEKLIVSPP